MKQADYTHLTIVERIAKNTTLDRVERARRRQNSEDIAERKIEKSEKSVEML